MQVKDLFKSDIYRTINGVVYADRLDSEIVWQELEEYVITKELMGYINKLFKTYGDSLSGSTGNNGVWISGFFGSGKSHFLKILSYLFENRKITREGVAKTALEFFKDKISDPMAFSTIEEAVRVPAEVILFNIDSLSFQNDEKAATLKAFFGAFNRKRGFCFNYAHIAHVEQFLSRKGVYKAFMDAFDAISGSQWYKEREDYVFYTDDIVKAIVKVLPNQSENGQLLDWITNGERTYPLTIENFATLVAEYVEEKGRRLLFMVDEMGQFVGAHSDRMLNLQTIVENLGTKTKDKAWVFVTSQEDIDSVLGVKIQNKGNDFSKIQARFLTRPSLSSSSIAEVIQKRLLRKRPESIERLHSLYTLKRDILLNQLSFSMDTPTMPSFKNPDDFQASYPFAPYQFNLLQDIFDAIRAVGATGLNLSKGERSMLDAFQTALKAVGEMEEGTLVPLAAFFPTIQSFLDGSVARSLYNAREIPGLGEFDHRLLETLFLIRYLKLRRIKGSIQNLSVLSLSEVDCDMVSLKRRIEESLARLEKENLISRQNDEFIFLTIEEQSITREIQNTSLPNNSDIRELAGFLFQDGFDGKSKYRHDNGKSFDILLSLDGYSLSSKGDLTIEIASPLGGDDYQTKKANGVLASARENQVLIILPEDTEYYRDLNLFLKTKTYLESPAARQTSSSEEVILAQKSNENNQRRQKLIREVTRLLREAHIYICGAEYRPNARGGAALLMEVARYLVTVVYKKLDLLPNPAGDWETMVRNLLTASSAALFGNGVQTNNPLALEEIRAYLDLCAQAAKTTTLDDIVKRFGAAPYGWPDGNAQVLVALMFRLDEVKLFKGGYIELNRAMDCFVKSSLYNSVSVTLSRKIADDTLAGAQALAKGIFVDFAPGTARELAEHFRSHFRLWNVRLSDYLRSVEHEPSRYPGVDMAREIQSLIKPFLQTSQNDELIETLNAKSAELKTASEHYSLIDGFFGNQITLWREAQKLLEEIKPNREKLQEDAEVSTAISLIEAITGDVAPYNRIKDLSAAIKSIEAKIDTMVEEAREGLRAKLEEYRNRLTPLCEELKLSPENSYTVKAKLNQLLSQVDNEINLSRIELMGSALAEKAFDDAIVVLQAFRNASAPKNAIPESKTNVSGEQARSQPVFAAEKPQPVEIVHFQDLIGRQELRTTEDVDRFVNSLRATLKQKLAQGKRIRLE